MNEAQINAIVEQVVRRLSPELAKAPSPGGASGASARQAPAVVAKRPGIFDDLDSAGAAATRAQQQWVRTPLETREKVIEAMREATRRLAEELARMAVEETGLGNVKDKIQKNLLCANKTPGLEIVKPLAVSGDHGLMLLERAPFGVIGAITPSTNPTETIINNALGMVAGGNAVVFNCHPSARGVCTFFISKLNDAITAAGGPANLVVTIGSPSIESAQALMKHAAIRLIVVTGGPAVVKAAMNSGKRAIAAGPGNPPAVVDDTADLARAGQAIVDGASLDNNIVCIVEKEVFAVASIADELKRHMVQAGAFEVPASAVNRLEKLVVDDGHAHRDWVGKDATKIAEAAGLRVPQGTRLLFAEVDPTHPFVQAELLMPVIGFSRLKTVEDCIAAALQAEHGFGHTATMHSTNIDHLSAMAKVINTSIFVKNGPSFAGLGLTGEGYTSFTIASPTGEGLTTALSFTRERRCTLKDSFRII
ncbi:MAG: aldehyde dehydrogenase EutE [Myxococcaceae bacterium]|nr:aldehyde dehydrogenase EutE [Myxococcaceae bacterium]